MSCVKNIGVAFASMCFFAACSGYNTFPKARAEGIDDPATLKALIDAGRTLNNGEYRIVDVRTESRFAQGHIPTAMNIPNGNLNAVRITPSENKMIIVYCESGDVAQKAAKIMEDAGYRTIYNWGSIGEWTLGFETGPRNPR